MVFQIVFWISSAACLVWWVGRFIFCFNMFSGLLALPVLLAFLKLAYDVYNNEVKDALSLKIQIQNLENRIKLLENDPPEDLNDIQDIRIDAPKIFTAQSEIEISV